MLWRATVPKSQAREVARGFAHRLGDAVSGIWWRRRELNPRPLARHYWLYMLRIRLLL